MVARASAPIPLYLEIQKWPMTAVLFAKVSAFCSRQRSRNPYGSMFIGDMGSLGRSPSSASTRSGGKNSVTAERIEVPPDLGVWTKISLRDGMIGNDDRRSLTPV